MAIENVVIVGSGPAAYTAAIYASRANLLLGLGLTTGLSGLLFYWLGHSADSEADRKSTRLNSSH